MLLSGSGWYLLFGGDGGALSFCLQHGLEDHCCAEEGSRK